MKQTTFTLLLSVLLSMVGLHAYASDIEVDGIYYNFNVNANTKTAEVTFKGKQYYSYNNEYTGTVVIPSEVTYGGEKYSVTSIGERAFQSCSGLTTVTIPNSVTSISNSAFYNCSGLTSVTIGNSVTSIGSEAFRGCSGLTSITIPNSVTSIGEWAFGYCSSLTSITIPNSVTSIGEWAFTGTAWYNNQPDGVVYAGLNVYEYKGTMPINTSIIIKEGTVSITPSAFSYCSGLTSITIPNSVMSIGKEAFKKCSGLTSVILNSNAIVSKTYNSGTNLKTCFGEQVKEYIIGDDVTSIGNYVFYNCSGLTSITISNSVTSIGNSAFYNCSGLTSITIPSSVTSIGERAFSSCSGLTSVTIGKGVKSIGNGAFNGCTYLIKLNLDCTIIENWFADIKSQISTLNLGDNVQTIGNSAFSGFSALSLVTIPNNVTSIGNDAFKDCSSLWRVNRIINSIEEWCTNDPITYGNMNSNPVTFVNRLYLYSDADTEITNIVIPDGVTFIRSRAFEKCVGITSITIPNSVTSIGQSAFSNCSALTSVTIGNSVTSIGGGAFESCSALTSITLYSNDIVSASYNSQNSFKNIFGEQVKDCIIGDGVTSIGNYFFYNCSGLTSITIPNSVTRIGNYAFFKCSKLASINIPNGVTSIGGYAFCWCGNLSSITIPNSLTTIDQWVFANCSGLTSITIPNSVTSIEYRAFSGCEGLESIKFGNGLTKIGIEAFGIWTTEPGPCNNLKKVIINDVSDWLKISFADPYANPLIYAKHLYSDENTEITDLTIPDVTNIPDYAFSLVSTK